jgi:endonuclease/exonuclease/phosphatase family metal-dependent hydrolase
MSQPLTSYLPQGRVFSNPVAEGVHWVGDLLTVPCGISLELVFKLIEPLEPGLRTQWSNTALEITHRALQVFAILLLLPLDLILTPIGIGLCALANLARRDFVFIYPELPGAPPEQNERFSITSFNVAFMPEFIAVRNGIRPTAERSREVPGAVTELDGDIVCLQEAFNEEAVLKTAQNLGAYPYKVMLAGQRTLGLSSGLCLFSKFPLENVTFWKHEARGGIEVYANKGLIGATVRLPGNRIAYVFNTHLSGGMPQGAERSADQIRSLQIAEIRAHIREYIAAHPPGNGVEVVGTFVAGDYNIGPDEGDRDPLLNPEWNTGQEFFRGEFNETYAGLGPEYHAGGALNDRERFGTAFRINDEDRVTGWDLTRMNEWRVKRECLDHILVQSQDNALIGAYSRHHMRGSSDHLALHASFTLRHEPRHEPLAP